VREERYKRQRSTETRTAATSTSREKHREGFGVEKDIVKEEETDSTEGRIPRCSHSTRPKRSGQLVIGKQAAKKLMLVDPQFLEQLKVDREYKQIQKPGDSIVKTNLSLDIGKTLNDNTLSDDQKVKRHRL